MYSDNYSIRDYGGMILDQARFTPYREALRRRVTADSVVLDIGAGTGILSFLACSLGARRVFAVEPDDAIEIGKLCAAGIPGSERITWIQDLSTQIDLPEQADIVVGDLHGVLPFYTGNIPSLADARKRHLKPGGRMLPQRDILHAVPASAPAEYRYVDGPWRSNDLGLDLAPALPYVTNTWWRARSGSIEPDNLLAPPAQWGELDYNHVERQALDRHLEWTIERDGTLHGLYVWFDGEIDDGLGFSNSPLMPELVYGRAFFPMQRAVAVEAGDRMRTRLSVNRVQDEFVYRWDTTIDGADGARKARFAQSTFRMQPGHHAQLRKSHAEFTPTLDERGQANRFILQQMDGSRSLRAIAMDLTARHGDLFPDFDHALAAVARLSQKHG